MYVLSFPSLSLSFSLSPPLRLLLLLPLSPPLSISFSPLSLPLFFSLVVWCSFKVYNVKVPGGEGHEAVLYSLWGNIEARHVRLTVYRSAWTCIHIRNTIIHVHVYILVHVYVMCVAEHYLYYCTYSLTSATLRAMTSTRNTSLVSSTSL